MGRLANIATWREGASVRPSKVNVVYESLKTAIVTGELRPGDPLDKVALAEKFGASRQPISLAIDRLAFDGLVDVVPQHGSFVSRLRPKPIAERFFIRRAVESEFAAMAATAVNDEMLRRLDLNLRYQQVAVEAGERLGFLQLDYQFHQIVCGQHAVDEAMRILDRLEAYLGRIRFMLQPVSQRPVETIEEHKAIRDAIASGKPAKASEAMRRHIDAVERHFQEFVIARPDLFEDE